VFAFPRLRPTVLAVEPLYAAENESVASVADRDARSFVNPDRENDEVATVPILPADPT
jgi:hypothetical protein